MMKCSRPDLPLNYRYSNRILCSALPNRCADGNGGTSIEHGTVRSTHAKLSLTTASLKTSYNTLCFALRCHHLLFPGNIRLTYCISISNNGTTGIPNHNLHRLRQYATKVKGVTSVLSLRFYPRSSLGVLNAYSKNARRQARE